MPAVEAVGQDVKEPRLEVGSLLEGAESTHGGEGGFLEQIFGVRAVAEQPERVPVGDAEDRREQRVEAGRLGTQAPRTSGSRATTVFLPLSEIGFSPR